MIMSIVSCSVVFIGFFCLFVTVIYGGGGDDSDVMVVLGRYEMYDDSVVVVVLSDWCWKW